MDQEPDRAASTPAATSVPAADRAAVERWFRLSGVPAFVIGNARPATVARHWYGVLAVAVLIGGALVLTASVLSYASWLRSPWVQVLLWLGAAVLGYAAIAIGLVEVAAFAARWFARIAWRSGGGMLRILPILLVALVFTFLSTETWQSIGRLTGTPLVLASVLVFGLALVPLLRSPAIDSSGLDDRGAVLAALPPGLPLADWLPDDGPLGVPALHWSERVNLRLVAVLGKAMVALVVGVAVAVFFLVFGVLVVDAAVTAAWSGSPPSVWWQFTVGAHTYTLTAEHLRVALFLGVFSAMYFIVSASTDRELAGALSADTEAHLTQCLAVRAAYRSAIGTGPGSAGEATSASA
jgi:hypothetical protein